MIIKSSDLLAILPLIILVGWASILLLVDVFALKKKSTTAIFAIVGYAVALLIAVVMPVQDKLAFNDMISADGFSRFLNILFLGSGILAVALSYDYLNRIGLQRGEYYTLMMFTVSGMMLMAYATDLIVVFLSLELLSIPLYVLSGMARGRLESEEAGLKYFLLGAFASGFVVYGIALVFGAVGSTNLHEVYSAVQAGTANMSFLTAGAGLIMVGLGFKVGAVPFHMWTPDVYQGAPSSVTAFMAVGAKAGGFAALLRIFTLGFSGSEISEGITWVLVAISVLTMILGNFLAISQKNIKRMLAYSSISHAGFILMAFVPYAQQGIGAGNDSVASALFYLLAFAITSFGVWAVVIGLEKAENGEDGLHLGLALEDYAGMGKKYPMLSAAMVVFMLSFTGLPLTLGFAGKLYLFRTAINGGYMPLAIVGVVTSLVSAYYYLRILIIMYMQDGDPVVHESRLLKYTALGMALSTVVLTIFANPIFSWAASAVLRMP